MKINWKTLAATPGYRSLKAEYIRDLHRSGRSKAELLKHFYWVIGRAQHYASHRGISVVTILNEWEAKRDYWWLNYYQNSNQPKLPSGKPRNVKPMSLNQFTTLQFSDPVERFRRLRAWRRRKAMEQRKAVGKKARWSRERKLNKKYVRK